MSDILKRINSFFAQTDIPAKVTEDEKLLILDGLIEIRIDKTAKKLIIVRGSAPSTEEAKKKLTHTKSGLTVDLSALADWGKDTEFEIDTKGIVYKPKNQSGKIFARWETPDTPPHRIFGIAGGSRIQAEHGFGEVRMDLHKDAEKINMVAEGGITGGKMIFSLGQDGDGFLSSLFPAEAFSANFDLEFGISSQRGLFFKGSSGLELVIPLHQKIGPINLETIFIGANIDSEKKALALSLSLSVGATLGPFSLVIEKIGTEAQFTQKKDGEILNQFGFGMGFLPPKGIGLAVDLAGMIKGGGYLKIDHDKGEYTGIAELAIIELVHLKAICIINTKMPDGKSGYSFLVLITAEFSPVQLGFGFTLNGVGGLIGVHRAMNMEAILQGIRTGGLEDILFPANPIADAPRILRTIGQTFPIQRDQYTMGLMAIIGWGVPTLIEARLGLMVQFPEFKIAILGIVECAIPNKVLPLIVIKSAFGITYDSKAKLIAFDASIFDSRILFMEFYGDMALRIKYGDNAGFLLSIGGFHPDYNPPAALKVGIMRRSTIVLLSGNPRLQVESYFAITSNTFQFGAKLDFYLALGPLKVVGFFGYDVLIQFSPFYFKISIEAYLLVQAGSFTLLSVYVYGALSGPNPWNFKGIGEFTVVLVSFEIAVDITWPDNHDTEQLESIEVLPLLKQALEDARNWEVGFPNNSQVLTTLRNINTEVEVMQQDDGTERVKTLIAHPFGTITVRQKIVPLTVELGRFGQFQPIDGPSYFIQETDGEPNLLGFDSPTAYAKDQFAADQFFNLSEAEKLSRPGFEAFPSGLILQDEDYTMSLNSDSDFPNDTIHTVRSADYEPSEWDDYNIGREEKELEEPWVETPILPDIFNVAIRRTLVARSAFGQQANFNQQHSLAAPAFQQRFGLTDKNTLAMAEDIGIQNEFSTVTEAEVALNQLNELNPNLAKQLQVSAVH